MRAVISAHTPANLTPPIRHGSMPRSRNIRVMVSRTEESEIPGQVNSGFRLPIRSRGFADSRMPDLQPIGAQKNPPESEHYLEGGVILLVLKSAASKQSLALKGVSMYWNRELT